MQWTDEGYVLSARKHGETALVVQLLTRDHGRHAGLVRGGAGRRSRGVFEPGNRVAADWRARLAEHLGVFRCDLLESNAAAVLDDPLRLAALSAASAVAERALPEREPQGEIYDGFARLVHALAAESRPADGVVDWMATYVRWELALLAALGFGLDLSSCAATGSSDDLDYVSPRSGRAVSRSAGAPYRDRLLPLPRFLIAETRPTSDEVAAGLSTTGYFLGRYALAHSGGRLPAARARLTDLLGRG